MYAGRDDVRKASGFVEMPSSRASQDGISLEGVDMVMLAVGKAAARLEPLERRLNHNVDGSRVLRIADLGCVAVGQAACNLDESLPSDQRHCVSLNCPQPFSSKFD